jgi:IS5 family transposase
LIELARWRYDTSIGPQVARRNASDLLTLVADKGYDKDAFRKWLRSHDVRPLIRHCLYAPYNYAHNAPMNDELYNRRWLTETCFSVVKRSHGATVRAQIWYCEFKECVLMFAIYNVERTSSAL